MGRRGFALTTSPPTGDDAGPGELHASEAAGTVGDGVAGGSKETPCKADPAFASVNVLRDRNDRHEPSRTMTESNSHPSSRSPGLLTPRRIVALVSVALFVLLIVTNRQSVTMNLLLIDVTGPLWLMLVTVFGLGAAVAWLWIGRRRRS